MKVKGKYLVVFPFLLASLLGMTLNANAAIFKVSNSTQFRKALNSAATNGEDDIIILADGTYKTTDDGYGTFTYYSNENNSLTIKGSSSKKVILSGANKNQILNFQTVNHNATLKLQNLTFMDGKNNSGNGGGVYSDGNIEVIDCNFTKNSANIDNVGNEYFGGGFYAKSAKVINSTFTNNSAYAYGGGFYVKSSATIINSTFTNNIAKHIFNSGGGGFYAGSAVTVKGSTFINNRSGIDGGGFEAGSSATVKNSTFSNNSAGGSGGGFNAGSAIVTNSTFTNNSAGGSGGGFNAGSAKVINSTFTNNRSGDQGGGFDASSAATVKGSTFTNNRATVWGGGFAAFSTYTKSAAIVINSRFTKNSAGSGGGFFARSVTAANSIFVKNSADNNGGGGFYASTIKASNLLFKDNSSGIYIENYKDSKNNIIINSIFLHNTFDIKGESGVVISHLENNYINVYKVKVASFKKNNIFDGVNLGFVDEKNGDYHLKPTSDLIDKGTTNIKGFTLPNVDMDNNPRVIGSTIDIGPYEFNPKNK